MIPTLDDRFKLLDDSNSNVDGNKGFGDGDVEIPVII
jgi:hypothetical protein